MVGAERTTIFQSAVGQGYGDGGDNGFGGKGGLGGGETRNIRIKEKVEHNEM